MTEEQQGPQEPTTEPTEPAEPTTDEPTPDTDTAGDQDDTGTGDDTEDSDLEQIDGPGDDEADEDEDEDEGGVADYAPGVHEAQLLSEREIEKRLTKLDNENERHRKRIAEILEDDALMLVPCPVCMDGPNGWVFDPEKVPLNPTQRENTLQLVGLSDFGEIPQAAWAQTCGTCGGYGRVKTGSKREGRETTGCLDCGEAGWINRHNLPKTNGHTEVEIPSVTGPTVFGHRDPDPAIQRLIEEGYTVVPPVILPTGV